MDVPDLAFGLDKFDDFSFWFALDKLDDFPWRFDLGEIENPTVAVSTPPGTVANNPASTNPLSPTRRCSLTTSQAEALCSYTSDERKPRISGSLHGPQSKADKLETSGELAGAGDERQHCSAGTVAGECQDIAHGFMNPNNIKTVGSTSSVAPSMTSCTSTHTASTSGVYSRKMLLSDEEDNSCDEAESFRFSKRRKSKRARLADPVRMFACPYRKHDPRKYEIHKWRSCAVGQWNCVSRVKEHLYRTHMVIDCTRCGAKFKTHDDLDSHFLSARPCLLAAKELPEGITPHIARALRSRKKAYRNQPEEERWEGIYRILFPREDVPSPYFEPAVEETVPTLDLDDFEEYSRREAPKVFRSLLESDLSTVQPGSDKWKNELMGVIEQCQLKIFSNYRSQFNTHQNMSTTEPTSDAAPEGRLKTPQLEHRFREN